MADRASLTAPPHEASNQPTVSSRCRSAPASDGKNVGRGERAVSLAAGSLLALLGLKRRNAAGLLVAGIGGGLLLRGATGHCSIYQTLGVDTLNGKAADDLATRGVHVTQSFLVDKPAEELYAYWRNFENLPQIMTHLKSVRIIDDRRSHWIAKAPSLAGGQVEWDAEITADQPNLRITWQSLPDADVENRGSVEFSRALGDRGTKVRAVIDYRPPGGAIGNWVATLLGESPAQQIREDLRNFKRTMEIGEVISTAGQPRGRCQGRGQHSTS